MSLHKRSTEVVFGREHFEVEDVDQKSPLGFGFPKPLPGTQSVAKVQPSAGDEICFGSHCFSVWDVNQKSPLAPVHHHQATLVVHPMSHHQMAPVAHHQMAPVAHHQMTPVTHHQAIPVTHHQMTPVAHHHLAVPVTHHQMVHQHVAPVHYQAVPVVHSHQHPHVAVPVAHQPLEAPMANHYDEVHQVIRAPVRHPLLPLARHTIDPSFHAVPEKIVGHL